MERIEEARQASEGIDTLRAAVSILSLSLDFKTTLESLAKLAVARLADWCGIFINESASTVRRLMAAQKNESGQTADSVDAIFPFDEQAPASILKSLDPLRAGVSDHLCMQVLSGTRRVGWMAFVVFGQGRRFDNADIATARDLASATAVALENARLYREIQEANRLKNEFVTMVSHELRTPLTPILGCIHLLRTAKLSEASFARALEMIERNAQAQVQIVEDLLDASRMVSGKVLLSTKPVDPAEVVGTAIESVRPMADSKGVEVVSAIDKIREPAEADPDRLRQVVWNLLSNAVKFTPSGGRVEIAMQSVNGELEIRVSDTGVGIATDVLPYVFDRFRRADDPSSKLRSGLGLGLAIVRHLVELHHGTVTAASPGVGQGACFTVRFPLQARKAATVTS